MTRKLQTVPNYYNKYTMAAIGDSLTDFEMVSMGVPPHLTWMPLLANRLNGSSSTLLSVRNFGILGTTTAEMIGRADALRLYSSPSLGVVWGGTNDMALGPFTGTATAGTATTITLPAAASVYLGAYVGNVITITGGTGSGQTRTIISYNGQTAMSAALGNSGVATVSVAWGTNPDATSTYSIAQPTSAQLQANIQALIKIYKYNVTGLNRQQLQQGGNQVYSQTNLPANAGFGSRFVVMNDTSTTGGLAANSTLQNATITGDYSSSPQQSVWEMRTQQAGELGWGRVAISTTAPFSDGCNKVVVINNNYYNFSTAGDNYNVATSTGSQVTRNITFRTAAAAAVTAENVVVGGINTVALCDLYKFQSYLIYGNGTATYAFNGVNITSETTQGSFSWHPYDSNLHHNKYGHETVARAMELTINAQTGWVTALSS